MKRRANPRRRSPAAALAAHALPGDPLRTETLPAETLPAETFPADLLPADPLPVEALPTEPLATESLPAEPLPTESLPAEPLATEALPSGTLLAGAVLACLLMATGGCARHGEVVETALDIPGCYSFEQVEGVPELGLPWGLELREEPLEGWPALADAFRARTWLSPEQPADHPFGYWMPLEGDSLRTGHPAGGGFDLVLALLGETGGQVGGEPGDLEGRGRAVGDALPPGAPAGPSPERPVLARRVECPTP